MNLLVRLLLGALALLLTAAIVPGIHASGFLAALVAALALALVNGFLRPILIFLTLPITLVTLGLFLLVINAGMLLLVGNVVTGFSVHGWAAALVGSLVLWLCSLAINQFVPDDQQRIHWDRRLIQR
ncbi:MAG TPA: phage holin family protein [Chloroflexota bacterium]|nr:phage holin family protein [Chloroflexota bacterium]